MKKLLALVLALVMTLGLATVSTSAALSDFSDASDVNYEEAMAVMNAVGVFVGDNGKLAPKDNLTRAQAAKIIAYLNLGGTAAESLSKDVTAFTDVPAGNWAAGYITYCYNAGIIAGDGTGKFNPNDNVTGLQFAKMLLVTLGYEAEREGLVGKDYALNTTKLAAKNELFKSNEGLSVNKPATREEAALYSFNALKAPTYAYDTASTTIKGADGLEVLIGGSNAKPVTTGSNRTAISDEDKSGGETVNDVLQLGEKLYKGDLKLNNAAATDYMNRPANVWTWKTGADSEIGRYEKTPDYTAVVKKADKTYDDIIDDYSKSAATNVNPHSAGNGNIVSINGAAWSAVSANAKLGDVVEVYMDSANPGQVLTVAVTQYSVGQLTADAATKGSGDDLEVRLPGVTGLTSWKDAEDVKGYEGLKKDDYVYYYSDNNGNYYVAKAEAVEGQLTGYKSGSTPKYTISGTDYLVNGNVGAITGLTTGRDFNTNYKYFQDANGFIIACEEVDDATKNYVMLWELAYAGTGSLSSSKKVEARIVKMDGTTEIVNVAKINDGTKVYAGVSTTQTTATGGKTGSEEWIVFKLGGGTVQLNEDLNTDGEVRGKMLFTYKVNSDGEYELTKATTDFSAVTTDTVTTSAGSETTYKPSSGKLANTVVSDNTVFVVLNDTSESTPKFTVYTGKNSAPNFKDDGTTHVLYTFASEKSVATHIVVWGYKSSDATGDYIFALSTSNGDTAVKNSKGDTVTYTTIKAYRDGKVEDILLDTDAVAKLNAGGLGLYGTLVIDSDTGAIKDMTKDANNKPAVFGYSASGSTLSTAKTYDKDEYAEAYNNPADAIYILKSDSDYTVGTASEMGSDANDVVYVALTNGDDNTVKVVYVQEKDADENGVMGVTYNGKSIKGSAATKSATIETVDDTSYTEYKDSTHTASKALVFTASAGSRVIYNTTGWAFGSGTSSTTVDNGTFTVSNAGTSDVTYYVKVIAEDTTVAYYAIFLDIAA